MINPGWREMSVWGVQSCPAACSPVMALRRNDWESLSIPVQREALPCGSLPRSHANKHNPHWPLPLEASRTPLSCAICRGGRESTGGSFISACWPPAVTDALGGLRSWGGGGRSPSPSTRDPQHVGTSSAGAPTRGSFHFKELEDVVEGGGGFRSHTQFKLTHPNILLGANLEKRRIHLQQSGDRNVGSAPAFCLGSLTQDWPHTRLF